MIAILSRIFARRPVASTDPGETINREDRHMFLENFDALIARRSERVSNRDRMTAAASRENVTEGVAA